MCMLSGKGFVIDSCVMAANLLSRSCERDIKQLQTICWTKCCSGSGPIYIALWPLLLPTHVGLMMLHCAVLGTAGEQHYKKYFLYCNIRLPGNCHCYTVLLCTLYVACCFWSKVGGPKGTQRPKYHHTRKPGRCHSHNLSYHDQLLNVLFFGVWGPASAIIGCLCIAESAFHLLPFCVGFCTCMNVTFEEKIFDKS